MKKRAFTLVELMIAFSIFVVIIGLVMTVIVGGFRSFGQGQKMAYREQRKRFVFFRMGKEISSITSITYPGTYFKGDEKSFFLFSIGRIIC
jgi:type II secretory pathway component PulJ